MLGPCASSGAAKAGFNIRTYCSKKDLHRKASYRICVYAYFPEMCSVLSAIGTKTCGLLKDFFLY